MYTPAFAKPSYKRIKPKVQKIKFERGYCYNCHTTQWLDVHHIFGGNPDRQHSDRYGLVVDLCHSRLVGNITITGCHNKVTDELDQDLIDRLQQEGQRKFEEVYSRDEFMRIFGRLYL